MMARPAHRRRQAGFALAEVTLALLLISLLAALALPCLVRATGPAALRVTVLRISALLREDRSAALRTGRASTAGVEADGRRVRSLTSSAYVDLPVGAQARVFGAPAGISFYGDGRASGGSIALATTATRYVIAISQDTGAIHVLSP
jgi:general secretion pathway protein H